jgi:C4-dicarboxylate-binding protein DctP
MTRRAGYVLILLAAVGALLSSIGCSPSAGGEVQMNGDMPVGHFTTVEAENFANDVTANTNFDVKFYPAGQLYADDVAPDALQEGACVLAQMGVGGEIEATVPETIILSGPTYTDMDWFYRFMYDTAGGGGWAYEVLEPSFERVGIKWLASSPYSPDFGCMTITPVMTVADYQGMKLRTPDKGFAAVFEGLGASPVVMSSSDVYMAIERGTIDGGVSGTTSFVSRKWYEVADYCMTLGTGPNIQMLLANLEWWNSLDDDTQDTIWQAAKDMEIRACNAALQDQIDSVQTLKDNGVEVGAFEVGTPAWQELKDKSASTVDAVMREALGSSYNVTQQLLAATEDGTMTWQEAINASR